MSDYLTDFVQESDEQITELNNALLTLEREPENGDAMENIFRIAHTLKGNCGAMGLESASELAHAIEDLLDAVRAGDLEVTAALMDVIFDAVDELETMFAEVEEAGEIETDPTETIRALRSRLEETRRAPSIATPTDDEIREVVSQFDPPADDEHDAYLARLAITPDEQVNNGILVVRALIDAFELLGTVPTRERIEAENYGGSFDAVFGSAVGETAIQSGLEPVDEVTDFELVDVTDAFEAVESATDAADAFDDAADEGISTDDAQDLDVDELLDEFDEFDNLDEKAEEFDDDDLAPFEDMGDAGSFDDLLDGAELDDEPAEAPEMDAADEPTDSTPADADDEVDDASAVFQELKSEVEMVGFDELQDELAELEFDEFDDEEEIGMDELLGEDVDVEDGSFLESDATGAVVDESTETGDDADPIDDASTDVDGDAEESATAVADADGDEPDEALEVDDVTDESIADVDDEADEAVTDVDDSGGPVPGSDDEGRDSIETAVEFDDAAVEAEPASAGDDVEADAPAEAAPTEDTAAADAPAAADAAAETSPTEVGADAETASTDADVDAETDEGGSSVEFDESSVSNVESSEDPIAEPAEFGSADGDAGADAIDDDPADESAIAEEAPTEIDDGTTAAEFDDERSDDTAVDAGLDAPDAPESEPLAAAADEPSAADTDESLEADVADDIGPGPDDADDDGTDRDQSESFDRDDDRGTEFVEDDFDDSGFDESFDESGFDDTFGAETVEDESFDVEDDSFGDDDFGDFDDDGFEDESFEDESFEDEFGAETFGDEPFDVEDDSFGDDDFGDFDDDGFEDEFGAETFGDEPFDVEDDSFGDDDFGDPEFGSAPAEPDDADDSSPASSFGDDRVETESDGDDVVRIVNEPEIEIPDITVPETADRPDAGQQTDEIQSVRVDVEQIDSLLTLVEGLVTSRVRLRHAVDSGEDLRAIANELDDLEDLTTELQETVTDVRLVPLNTVTNRLPRVVRDIARNQDKEIEFEMTGGEVELDRSILDRIGDPLIHLVRNAVDHGVEPPEEREAVDKPREGRVTVSADRSRDQVRITVSDDGSGLDPERLRNEAVEADVLDEDEADDLSDEDAYELIFHPGLSTADEVTDVSGRGVGMDVVKRTIQDLEGTVEIESEPGAGTTVTMTLPVTVAIDDILFLECGGEEFGVPTKAVDDIGAAATLETVDETPVLREGDDEYPVLRLDEALETPASGANGDGMIVRIRDEVRPIVLHCDEVHGQQEVVVKPFEGFMGGIPGLSGATVRGRGEVVNILDVNTL